MSLKQAQCATMSQVKIQYTEKVIEKYTENNQMVKCVYSISLRIQPSLLASHAAREVLRKRRCPSRKTSLPDCIRLFLVIFNSKLRHFEGFNSLC